MLSDLAFVIALWGGYGCYYYEYVVGAIEAQPV